MMTSLRIADVVLYVLQVTALVVVAHAASALAARRLPRLRVTYWRAVIAVCVALPLLPSTIGFTAGRQVAASFHATADLAEPSTAAWPSVAIVLLAGTCVRLLWVAAGLRHLRTIRREGLPATIAAGLDAAVLRRTAEFPSTSRRWFRRADVAIVAHPDIRQPASFGWRRPVIVVPAGFGSLPADVQQAVLAHERVHIANNDWLHLLTEQIVRTVLWFQPALWWALDQLQLAREQFVDDEVVRTAIGRSVYARALLAFADAPAPAAASALLERRHLGRRIQALADRTPVSRGRRIAAIASLLAAVLFATVNVAALNDAQRDRAYYPGNGVTLPRVVREVKPDYTNEAMKAKIQGRVTLACVVNTDGAPEDIVVEESLDREYGLDDEAVAALRRWRFEPGTKDGRPVPVRITVQMAFTLK